MQAALATQSRRLDTAQPASAWPDDHAPLSGTLPALPLPAFAGHPAEACTELGANAAPVRLSWWRRLLIACLQWQLDCLTSEREHYLSLGWVGPVYLVNSYAQQRELMTRIRKLGGEAQE